jgi:hypothetical protein
VAVRSSEAEAQRHDGVGVALEPGWPERSGLTPPTTCRSLPRPTPHVPFSAVRSQRVCGRARPHTRTFPLVDGRASGMLSGTWDVISVTGAPTHAPTVAPTTVEPTAQPQAVRHSPHPVAFAASDPVRTKRARPFARRECAAGDAGAVVLPACGQLDAAVVEPHRVDRRKVGAAGLPGPVPVMSWRPLRDE